MTLVELLVVVAILMGLILVGLPAMTPTKEARAIREAARSIDLMLGAARNQAMASGRPMGVMLERMPEQPLAGVTIYPAEEPAPYSGEFVGSTLQVQLYQNRRAPSGASNDYGLPPLWAVSTVSNQTSPIATGMVHVYDLIQFNNQGPFYCILSSTTKPASDGSILPPFIIALDWQVTEGSNYGSDTVGAVSLTGLPWNPPWNPPWTAATPVNFRIFRQPVRSGSEALELPPGAAIDFQYSGYSQGSGTPCFAPVAQVKSTDPANDPSDPADFTPIFIMFAPNGSIAYIYHSYNRDHSTHAVLVRRQVRSDWFNILIGKRKRVGLSGPDGFYYYNGVYSATYISGATWYNYTNYYDPERLFIAINSLTGTSIVTEDNTGYYNAMSGH